MSISEPSIPPPAGAEGVGDSSPGETAGRRYLVAAAAVVLVALAIRLIFLGKNSFWIDEINVLSYVRSPRMLAEIRNRGGPFESPLHLAAVWLAERLPGVGFEAAARVPAAVAGTVEVLGLILVSRRLTARRDVALLAGGLLALAPFAVRYSQEARYYSMFSAALLISWWLIVRAVQERTRGAFLWWGGSAGLLVLTHPFAPLAVLAQLAFASLVVLAARRRGHARPDVFPGLLLGLGVMILIVLPWYAWGALRWIPDAIDGRFHQLNAGALPPVQLSPDLFKRAAIWVLGNDGRWTVLSGLVALLVGASVVNLDRRLRQVALGVAAYGLVFFVALVPLTHVMHTYYAVRRVEFLLPPALLLAALGVTTVVGWARRFGWPERFVRRTALGIVGLLVVLSLVAVGSHFEREKTNYRGLAAVVARADPGDLVVIGPVDQRWPGTIRQYLHWSGVDRRVHFVVFGRPLPVLHPPRSGRVVWLTGSPPGGHAFRTRALNSLADLEVIAGDRTAPGSIVAWFASRSGARSESHLRAQLERIGKLPVVLPPPDSPVWGVITGR